MDFDAHHFCDFCGTDVRGARFFLMGQFCSPTHAAQYHLKKSQELQTILDEVEQWTPRCYICNQFVFLNKETTGFDIGKGNYHARCK